MLYWTTLKFAFDEIGDFRVRQDLLMHLGAVDATALLEDHHQPLAFFAGGLDVLGNIAEGQRKPVLLVQAVLADLGRPGLERKGRERRKARLTRLIMIFSYPMVANAGNISSSHCAIRDI
jgi:hypothetical protein